MDISFDIFQIYRQYCDITAGVFGQGDEFQKARMSREALTHLLKVVESKVNTRVSILEEVYKLMSRLDLMGDYSEFSRFYNFVFFICRENGQKNITVSRAIMAWRLVLAGRFRLLNQWCSFIEKNQRHNISEDTWRQVLAFSRCVHENLEGYDPEEAWPVLIDDFVEYMYRISGFQGTPNLLCNCGDSEPQQCDDILSGLKHFPGSKRRSSDNLQTGQESKRSRLYTNWEEQSIRKDENGVEIIKQSSNSSPIGCTKSSSPCAIEGCLSEGFAGLLSGRGSCLQFDHDSRVSYT